MAIDVLGYIAEHLSVKLTQRSPIEIPELGRDDLARLFALWGFRRGVEIGVERGLYSEVLCRENPGLELYAVDAWQVYRGYRDHVDQEKLNRFHAEARERLDPLGVTVIRQWSAQAAASFAPASLDFVYLDGNHGFEHLTADLAAWSPKVRPGGVIAGHDFVRYKWPNQIHVVQVVTGWTDAYEIAPWFLLGRQAKRPDETRDDARSWFWVQREPRVLPARKKPIQQ